MVEEVRTSVDLFVSFKNCGDSFIYRNLGGEVNLIAALENVETIIQCVTIRNGDCDNP